jgi:hypothetical protein
MYVDLLHPSRALSNLGQGAKLSTPSRINYNSYQEGFHYSFHVS